MNKKKTWTDYLFCLFVGGIYLYAINRAIISATFIRIEPLTLYLIGVISIAVFLAVLFNRYTIFFAAICVLLITAFVLFTFEDPREQYPHFYEVYLMVTGRLGYRPHLGRTVVWIISLLLAFVTVVFMLHQFNFYFLALGGAAAFILTWMPGFSRDETAFLFFLFAFCLILIRKTNKSAAMVLAAAPLCLLVVWLANARMPYDSEMFIRRYVPQYENGPVTIVRNFFNDLFTPVHFTFQSTGFSGAGGRLGGPITPNNRFVMTVYAPGRTYLAGATSNTYTGFSWIQTLEDGDINTHGLAPARFEMLETTAALIRGATHTDFRASIHVSMLGLSPAETRRLHSRQFPVLGVMEEFTEYFVTHDPTVSRFPVLRQIQSYWHTYLPFETLSIQQSATRTGTIFQPPRAIHLWFDENSADYSADVQILPTGDMQTRGFMGRNTSYHMRFLNVDTSLSFIENILRRANPGVYESHGAWGVSNLPRLDGTAAERLRGEFVEFEDHLFRTETAWTETAAFGDNRFQATITTSPFGDSLSVTVTGHPSGEVFEEIFRELASVQVFAAEPEPQGAVTLPELPLDVAGFASLVEFFTQYTSYRVPIRYIDDAEHFMHLLDSFSNEILAQYAREVREHFLDVPEIVPQRVHDLTAQIIEGRFNDFGRVMAIRDFLLQFPYTLEPVHVPRDVCFVDFFLFEGQEGYCTYFASAMAVMARIAGVPSRYVEGFVLPPTENPNEPVMVTNRMAHAWVEVYLEGFGWKIIEATPTYALLFDHPDVVIPPGGGSPENWIDHELLARLQGALDEFEIPDFMWQGGGQAAVVAEEEIEHSPLSASLILAAIFAVAALCAAVFFATRIFSARLRARRVKNLLPNEQVNAYFLGILDIVTYYTKPLTPEETPKAYGLHMGKRFAFRSDSVFFRDLIALYYKAKYSPEKVSENEIELMKEAYNDMLGVLREMHRWVVYLYLRYVRRVGILIE